MTGTRMGLFIPQRIQSGCPQNRTGGAFKRRPLTETFAFYGKSVKPVPVLMVCVIPELAVYIKKNDKTARHADSEAGNIDG